jgi:hypothetical protein
VVEALCGGAEGQRGGGQQNRAAVDDRRHARSQS